MPIGAQPEQQLLSLSQEAAEENYLSEMNVWVAAVVLKRTAVGCNSRSDNLCGSH